LILGALANAYFGRFGISIASARVTGILMRDTIYADPTLQDTIALTIVTFVVTLIASVYPAMLAAQMEPVEALHG
jgi:ABC-type lipoprotein release transport system permease subunit